MNDFGFCGPYYEPGLIGPDGKLTRLHKGGGGIPKETEAQKRQAKLQEKLLEAQLKQIKKGSEMPAMPAPPPPPEPAAPPPTQTANDISQAEMDARRVASRRKGLMKSVIAGANQNKPTMAGSTMLT